MGCPGPWAVGVLLGGARNPGKGETVSALRGPPAPEDGDSCPASRSPQVEGGAQALLGRRPQVEEGMWPLRERWEQDEGCSQSQRRLSASLVPWCWGGAEKGPRGFPGGQW